MALDYSYQQAAGIPVNDFTVKLHQRAVVEGVLRADSHVEQLLGRGGLSVGGAVVSIRPKPPHQLDPVANDFDFAPTVAINVRLDKFGDLRVQTDELVSLAVTALQIDPGDSIGHVGYERIWLLRRGGRLVLGNDSIWTPERLAMVPFAYERGDLLFSDG